ncbi:MAG: hypothetical protein WAX33_03635 [Rectinemataceae bacterium]
MDEKGSFDRRAKTLLVLFGVCAFLAIFSTVDTSEQYRAWRAAMKWTEEQKAAAPAMDVVRMHTLILVDLALQTAVIAVSFAGGLTLGVAIATDNGKTFRMARAMGIVSLGMGVCYSVLSIAYEVLLGPRKLLKGPIFDYDMTMQPPVIAATAGFLLLALVFGLSALAKRRGPKA